ncbi:MAG: hypothetical protein ABIP51_24045 [Bacteroidia bacterium]
MLDLINFLIPGIVFGLSWIVSTKTINPEIKGYQNLRDVSFFYFFIHIVAYFFPMNMYFFILLIQLLLLSGFAFKGTPGNYIRIYLLISIIILIKRV